MGDATRAGAAQWAAKVQFATMVAQLDDGVIVHDSTGQLLYANAAAGRLAGFASPEELLAAAPSALMRRMRPQDDQSRSLSWEALPWRQVMADGQHHSALIEIDQPAATESRWVSVKSQPLVASDGQIAAVMTVIEEVADHGVTQQILERRVAERTQELMLLLDVARSFAATLDLEEMLGIILDQLRRALGCSDVAIFRLDGTGATMLAHRGNFPAEKAAALTAPIIFAGSSISRKLWTGKPLYFDDLAQATPEATIVRESGAALVGEELPLRSLLLAPMIHQGNMSGFLALGHGQPGYFTERHSELAEAIASHAAVALENARLYQHGQAAAVLEERQRLARELHDSVAQLLYGIGLNARVARAVAETKPPEVIALLDEIRALASAGLAEMRTLIFALRPEALAQEGLIAGIKRQVEALQARRELALSVELGDEPDLPLVAKEVLYRIAQEALNNVVRHARATTLMIRFALDDAGWSLQVEDDGIGFDPTATFPGHLGLRSMRERIEHIHGTLTITSAPGAGTRLRATIPLAGRTPAET